MLNFQVDNLPAIVMALAEAGVRIEDHLGETDDSRIAWAYDPEGNKIELWESASFKESLINFPEAE
jgi:hypothetical protein